MSNIYGAGSPQSFEGVSLTGGNKFRYTQPPPNVRIMDASTSTSTQQSYSMVGGRTVSKQRSQAEVKEEDWPIYANALYIKNDDLQRFLYTFSQLWNVANARYNAITVLPDHKTVEACCKEWEEELKSKGFAIGSVEASKYTAKSNCKFNRYIFDVFSQNPPNNAGMEYHVSSDFPLIANKDEIIRRTNRDNQVCFFKFNSSDEIICSDSIKFPDDANHTVKLSLLGRCQAAVFILKGNLPKSITEAEQSKANAIYENGIYTLTGGNLANNRIGVKESFIKEFNKAGRDIESACYNFFGKQALQAIYGGEDQEKVVERMAKYYKGDHVFNAMSLLSDKDAKLFPINEEFDKEELEEIHKMFIDKMSCSAAASSDKINKFKNSISAKYIKAQGHPGEFIHSLNASYKNAYHLIADATTPYIKKHTNIDGINNVFKFMNSMSNLLKDKNYSGAFCTQIGGTCALNTLVLEALSENPTYIRAMSNVPSLINRFRKPKRVLRHKMTGGSIYGGEGDTEPTPKQPIEKEPSAEEITKIEDLQIAQNKPLFDNPSSDEDMTDDDGASEEILSSFASFTD
jgi:hypothetical protein